MSPASDGANVIRCDWAEADPLLRHYHDVEWGLPIRDEQGLFERLSLEAFQSGLSWLTILRKRDAFRDAFMAFEPDRVAHLSQADIERLMQNPQIIRNRAKIEATRRNAQATIALRAAGGLAQLIWSHQPIDTPRPMVSADVPTQSAASRALALDLRNHGFSFVGPTTAHALMEAVGMIDTHLLSCHRRGCSGEFARDR